MAIARVVLDTRNNSKKKDGSYPIALRVHHKKTRYIALGYSTSLHGWDDRNGRLKKSDICNQFKDYDSIEDEIHDKLYLAKKKIKNFGDDINKIDVSQLVREIKDSWDKQIQTTERHRIDNSISLVECGNKIIERKRKMNSPSTAEWYQSCMNRFLKFIKSEDIRLDEITVSILKDYEVEFVSRGNKPGTINSYMRGIRAIYNKAIEEDEFKPLSNPFKKYRIPTSKNTKKRATSKDNFLEIRNLKYPEDSILWHAKNYILIMFNCRGMNLVDLVKLKFKNINGDRLYYGRSKTGDPLSVKITSELSDILSYYIINKNPEDYLFPINYDGSTEHYEKYKSIRRRVNERLKIIAVDAGIEEKFTTYSIRHSWATIAKYLGISTEVISEGLGHNSLRTTQVYLKNFENNILDDANERIVG
jgi:integrase/recombinase XerD